MTTADEYVAVPVDDIVFGVVETSVRFPSNGASSATLEKNGSTVATAEEALLLDELSELELELESEKLDELESELELELESELEELKESELELDELKESELELDELDSNGAGSTQRTSAPK